jgi:hypothetical protein
MRYVGGSGGKNIPSYYSEPKDTLDVVYIGGSTVFCDWAPMEAWNEFGFTSYDFSNNTIPPQVIKYCITEALKQQNPKLVIIDVVSFSIGDIMRDDEFVTNMYAEFALRNFTDGFHYSYNRYRMVQESVPKEYNRLDYHFDIAKYHVNTKAFIERDNIKNMIGTLHDYKKGNNCIPTYSTVEREDFSSVIETIHLTELMEGLLSDLLDYCDKLEKDVLFIVPPYGLTKDEFMKYNYMQRVVQERGYDFLNCNVEYHAIGLDEDTDYNDSNHLNIFGAIKYTHYLGDYVKVTYTLPDHRKDSKYVKWEKEYFYWEIFREDSKDTIRALMPTDIQQKMK